MPTVSAFGQTVAPSAMSPPTHTVAATAWATPFTSARPWSPRPAAWPAIAGTATATTAMTNQTVVPVRLTLIAAPTQITAASNAQISRVRTSMMSHA